MLGAHPGQTAMNFSAGWIWIPDLALTGCGFTLALLICKMEIRIVPIILGYSEEINHSLWGAQ